MSSTAVSERIQKVLEVSSSFHKFFVESRYMTSARGTAGICDFVFGNPNEMPLPGFVQALKDALEPQDKDWFAYKMSEPTPRDTVSASLRRTHGMAYEPEDIHMTTGVFGALSVALGTITDPGDEIIYISPPWFFYEPMIVMNHAAAVRVPCHPETFDLDLNAIHQAITPRTRAIIVNSPNNPTGKIYPPETLESLAALLSEASGKIGRTIYLLSDESYNRIVFDGRRYPSPTPYYPASMLLYTYGKTLLTPGQRVGYLAVSPNMPERELINDAILMAQMTSGYAFPNALLQHALPDLEKLSIDVGNLQARRDQVVAALTQIGYQTSLSEGTFYLVVRSPLEDDWQFCDLLADEGIYVLPGSTFEMPGYFRISLTANDEMVEQSLPGFRKTLEKAAALRSTSGIPQK